MIGMMCGVNRENGAGRSREVVVVYIEENGEVME